MTMPAAKPWQDDLPKHFFDYAEGRRIDEVECIVPDLAGTSRGKAMPSAKFDPSVNLALPISLFYQTISGEYVDMEIENQWLERDVVLRPDMGTATAIPWSDDDVSVQVICDMFYRDGSPLPIAPRNVLRRVLAAYADKGWYPSVAPELEFYLTKPNLDPNEPIEPPIGRTGRKGASRQVYSMAAVDEYGPVIDTIYDFAEAQGLQIDTVIQEGGAGQIEINLLHGDPLKLADQVFYFKRTIREAALKNGIFATFMAKPIRDAPGSAMHLHQSVVDDRGRNIFSNNDGSPSELFRWFIGGSQHHMMDVVPLFAPYVNSYRRITVDGQSAPANLEWAVDNRTTGFRVPHSGPEARRLENRVIGMDCNPYTAIATSLACGFLGMVNQHEPRREATAEVWEAEIPLPTSLKAALDLFDQAAEFRAFLGEEFCQLYSDIKWAENEEYQREISPWEREHLLLNV